MNHLASSGFLLSFLAIAPMALGQESTDSRIANSIQQLKDPDTEVRFAASDTLSKSAGPDTAQLVPVLADGLKDSFHLVRANCAIALWRIGTRAAPAQPALTAALKDESPIVRAWAGRALGSIGPGARAALPGLIGALEDTDARVRRASAVAIVAIEPASATPAVPVLIEVLRFSDADDQIELLTRDEADEALSELRSTAADAALEALKLLTDDADPDVRNRASALIIRLSEE